MKGFVLAAGLGSRLKPWTDSHPKALVPVGGLPALQRVVEKMYGARISDVTVNVYHFADQIRDFISAKGWDVKISDERPYLLETGGALLHASPLLSGDEPVLVHNVDIISNADFKLLENAHVDEDADVTLLVNSRDSSRKLLFSSEMRLCGWHSLVTDEFRPPNPLPFSHELSFSGIYIVSPKVFGVMRAKGFSGRFSIIDFLLSSLSDLKIRGLVEPGLKLLDIGKPESLARADAFIRSLGRIQ